MKCSSAFQLLLSGTLIENSNEIPAVDFSTQSKAAFWNLRVTTISCMLAKFYRFSDCVEYTVDSRFSTVQLNGCIRLCSNPIIITRTLMRARVGIFQHLVSCCAVLVYNIPYDPIVVCDVCILHPGTRLAYSSIWLTLLSLTDGNSADCDDQALYIFLSTV